MSSSNNILGIDMYIRTPMTMSINGRAWYLRANQENEQAPRELPPIPPICEIPVEVQAEEPPIPQEEGALWRK